MFLAMNRFRIALGKEAQFEDVWRQRDSHLGSVPGFVRFHLIKGETTDEYTLYASHTEWETKQHFEDWTQSEAFRLAHVNAGKTPRDIFIGGPQLELFESVL